MPIVRQAALHLLAVALLVTPSLADFAVQRSGEVACRMAACCVGKTTTCPMHHNSANDHAAMRSCSSGDSAAIAPMTAVLAPRPTAIVAETLSSAIASPAHPFGVPAAAPPTPPPQRS